MSESLPRRERRTQGAKSFQAAPLPDAVRAAKHQDGV